MHIFLSSGGALNTLSFTHLVISTQRNLHTLSRFPDQVIFLLLMLQYLSRTTFNSLLIVWWENMEKYLWTTVNLLKLDINAMVTLLANQISYKLRRSTFSLPMSRCWYGLEETNNDTPTRLRSVQLKMLRHLLLLLLKLLKLVVKLVVKRKIRRLMLCATPLLLLTMPAVFLSNHSQKEEKKELSPKISWWA